MCKVKIKKQIHMVMLLSLLSIFTAFADSSFRGGTIISLTFVLKSTVYMLLYCSMIFLVDKFYQISLTNPYSGILNRYFSFSKKNIVRTALFFIVLYSFYLIVFFPGTCGFDTVIQIDDLITGEAPRGFNFNNTVAVSALMNDHHPVFTTIVFTGFYKIGVLVGQPNYGMALYCLLQIIIMSFLFSSILCLMQKVGIPSIVAFFCAVYYCMPFIALYVITMIKDSLFSMMFVVYYLLYILIAEEICTNPNRMKRRWFAFFVFSILVALCNKKGMYIAFISNILLVFLLKGKRERIYAILSGIIPAFVIAILLNQVLFPVFNIYTGGPQESLGFAIQQLARVRIELPDDFSDADNMIFQKIIPISFEELSESFDPKLTDGIKNYYNYYATDKDRLEFIQLWAKKGLRHPTTYLKTTFEICGGYFAPIKKMNFYFDTKAVKSLDFQPFMQPERLGGIRKSFVDWIEWIENTHPIDLFFQNALYVWLIPLVIAILLIKFGIPYRLLLLTPISVNILFLVIGPTCWTRYGLCQIYTIPLQIGLLFAKESNTVERNCP